MKHDIRYFDLYAPLRKDVDQLIWIDGLHYRAAGRRFFPRADRGRFCRIPRQPRRQPADVKSAGGRADVERHRLQRTVLGVTRSWWMGRWFATSVEPHRAGAGRRER